MERKEKLIIVALVAVIANGIIALGIINNEGKTTSNAGCFTTEKGVKICR